LLTFETATLFCEYPVISNQLDVTFSKFFTLFLQPYMFRASLAHPQEAQHEHSFGVCSVLL
jgi:hypothetical protein